MASDANGTRASREACLAALGVEPQVAQELCARNVPLPSPATLPLGEDPQEADWEAILARKAGQNTWELLLSLYPQLHFAPSPGLAATEGWRGAVLRGEPPPPPATPPPTGLRLLRVRNPWGWLPALVFARREEFVRTWQLLACRGEPQPVPASMGASLVRGAINWGRLRAHTAAVLREKPRLSANEALAAVSARPELYRDRLILVCRGSYSGIPTPAGFSPKAWLACSLRLRLAHEAVHDFTVRAFGQLGHTVQEELVADWWGLVQALGRYDPFLAKVFLGVENPGSFRPGGRLANYQGTPPLSTAAFRVLAELAAKAVDTLATLPPPSPREAPAVLAALLCTSLEELAAGVVRRAGV